MQINQDLSYKLWVELKCSLTSYTSAMMLQSAINNLENVCVIGININHAYTLRNSITQVLTLY